MAERCLNAVDIPKTTTRLARVLCPRTGKTEMVNAWESRMDAIGRLGCLSVTQEQREECIRMARLYRQNYPRWEKVIQDLS